jgi:hypothetical protein
MLCRALVSDGYTRLFSDRAAARRTLEKAVALVTFLRSRESNLLGS